MLNQIKSKAEVVDDGTTLFVKIKHSLTDEESLYLHELAEQRNLNLEMTKANLTPEEADSLRRMREFEEKVKNVPQAQRFPISNPDKYDFPIGIDDNGNLFK